MIIYKKQNTAIKIDGNKILKSLKILFSKMIEILHNQVKIKKKINYRSGCNNRYTIIKKNYLQNIIDKNGKPF